MGGISLERVSKLFPGGVVAVDDVDMEIGDGEFMVLVGPSGCGKSTLLRMISGLEDVSDGELVIGGRRVNDVSAAERGLAMVFQSYALYPHMTVYQNMAFGLENIRTPRAQIEAKVQAAARLLQLDPLLQRRPTQLSGGQRQRVAIGRAIVREPSISMSPDVALSRPQISRSSVDLPQPDGPTNTTNSPSATARSMPWITRVASNCLTS